MLTTQETAIFGAGCFWGVEEIFRKISGVLITAVGYMGGSVMNPTYEDVCTGQTGHAEVLYITFDPSVVSYAQLLEIFWSNHNPTQFNRQGPDVGTQYRSVIFYYSLEQKQIAEVSRLAVASRFLKPITTSIEPSEEFYPAEQYHQHYFEKRGGGTCRVV